MATQRSGDSKEPTDPGKNDVSNPAPRPSVPIEPYCEGLDDRLEDGEPFFARFSLVRMGARLECEWTCQENFEIVAHFADAPKGEWLAYDALSVLDQFTEAIEAAHRPSPVPEGHEVWRFDRSSLRARDPGSELDEPVRQALEAILDETFNAPSLYDPRELRRPQA